MSPVKFLIEFFMRFITKSPRFFQILQVSSGILTGAGYVPSMLQVWFKVEVPGHVISLCETVAEHALTFFIASMLPADTKTAGLAQDGTILKKTNEKKLPYTAKVEEKQAIKELQQAETVPEQVELKVEEPKKDEQ